MLLLFFIIGNTDSQNPSGILSLFPDLRLESEGILLVLNLPNCMDVAAYLAMTVFPKRRGLVIQVFFPPCSTSGIFSSSIAVLSTKYSPAAST